MQAEPESSTTNSKGDVDGITFRPSSNFIHMKKYRKGAAASGGGETRSEDEESKVGEASTSEAEAPQSAPMQPPLPSDPPPPDSPPPITLKKEEIEDDEYRADEDPEDTTDKEERHMCREFARGSCIRGSSCKYAHEIILSQLPGIYTFCKDFQNSTCTFPRCKFVHASVFEKELFYRTGYLPPHALAHLNKENEPKQLPPQTERGQAEATAVFPKMQNGTVMHAGVSGVVPTGGSGEPRVTHTKLAAPGTNTIKREWRALDESIVRAAAAPVAAPPTHVPLIRPPLTSCPNCPDSDQRLQCSLMKLEKLIRSNRELDKKLAALNEKSARQNAVLTAVARHQNKSPRPPHPHNSTSGPAWKRA